MAGRVGGDALLDEDAELVPEGAIRLGILFVLGQALDLLGDAAGQRLAKLAHHRVALHHLTRDIERQILGIDHAFHKAQIVGQQIAVALLDQHLARVETQPVIRVCRHQIALALGGHKEDAAHVDRHVGDQMHMGQRIVEVEGQLLVEVVVLAVFHRGRRLAPDGRLPVDRLGLGDLFLSGLRHLRFPQRRLQTAPAGSGPPQRWGRRRSRSAF